MARCDPPPPHTFPAIIEPISARREEAPLAWDDIWLQSVILSRDSHAAFVGLACIFRVGDCLDPVRHLSHLYILVMCTSCTNSWCLRESVCCTVMCVKRL